MMKRPLVSVIVPTYNSALTLAACLDSIKTQSYEHIELIVVDNFSTDGTAVIANEYADIFTQIGPERSAQRNYGASKAGGSIVVIIDSDMELTNQVVEQCVNEFTSDLKVQGLVIPEESFGIGFWAQCKKLERSYYVGVPWMEAARAFRKETYLKVGGYNEAMISGEDWDLSQRIAKLSKLGRISAFILHNEGKLNLSRTLRKKYYYSHNFKTYTSINSAEQNTKPQTNLIARYKLYFNEPSKLLRHPVLGAAMLVMKTLEFSFGAFGILSAAKKK